MGACSLNPGLTEVVIFGGLDGDCDLTNTVIMRFGELNKSKVIKIKKLEMVITQDKVFAQICIILI